MVHHMKCSEVWGGNRGDALDVETSAVRASLFSRACDGGKGGDIYYFSVCGSDQLTRIAIVDVVGHGESVSDTSQWLYESLSAHMDSGDGTEVLADLNRASVAKGYEAMSTAAVVAFYRENSSLYFSYAGHHPLLLNRNGTGEWIPITGEASSDVANIMLGVDAHARFIQNSLALSGGDRLFLYTDGVIEAPDADDDQFGHARLVDTLTRTSGEGLDYVRSSVLDALLSHTANSMAHDDVTFMAVEIREP